MATESITPTEKSMAEKQGMVKIIIAAVVILLLIAAIIFFVNSKKGEADSLKDNPNIESLSEEENSLITQGSEIISEDEELDLGELI